MNEINFKMEEIEEINLKLDTSIKEIYPPLTNLEVIPTKEKQIFNHDGAYGYDKVVVNSIILQDKEVIPTKEEQTIKADENYNGLSQVKVNAVTSQADNNIISENIKNGIDILGVTGNFVGGKYAPRFISFFGYTGTELEDEINNLDTSKITSMERSFSNCYQLTNLDLSSLNTINVTNMNYAFNSCRALTSLNLTNFNTSNVTTMEYMFHELLAIPSLDLSDFNTEKVKKMGTMFGACRKLTSLNVKSFNTKNVTDMSSMFYQCMVMKTFDLSSFNVEKVTNMQNMFYQCYELTELDLSNFVTPVLKYASGMFINCTKLTKIDMRNFDFTNITSYNNMFGTNATYGTPDDCLIIVKDDTQKTWITSKFTRLTNVKTVAELEAS